MARTELLLAGAVPDDSATALLKTVVLVPDSFAWLKNIAKSFERVRWNSCVLQWRPAVGTTTSGVIAYGAAWDCSSTDPPNREDVLAQTPVADHPIWQTGRLSLPVSRLRSRAWYQPTASDKFDAAPCSLKLSMSATNLKAKQLAGEWWVTYDITMAGTQKA